MSEYKLPYAALFPLHSNLPSSMLSKRVFAARWVDPIRHINFSFHKAAESFLPPTRLDFARQYAAASTAGEKLLHSLPSRQVTHAFVIWSARWRDTVGKYSTFRASALNASTYVSYTHEWKNIKRIRNSYLL